ncbi:MAG: thioredoxin-disulfide reductase [Thermodesulfobacteriota bacterium]
MPDSQLIIIGGGPAGLTAGIYAARSGLNALLLEKGASGGQLMNSYWIDNYPGFPEGISGFDLAEKMVSQAERFKLPQKMQTVASLDLGDKIKKVNLENGRELTCNSIIITTGARPKDLGVPGEKKLTGKGVSYCATCDGPFFKNQEIAVIGGGNTAVQEADHLSRFASKVTIVHRRNKLKADKILQEKAFANQKIEFIWDSVVTEITGNKEVDGIGLQNKKGEESTLPVKGVFILIGIKPNKEILPLNILANQSGFIKTDQEMCASVPGVMAAGDIRDKEIRQIVNAAGEGAVACLAAQRYLAGLEK